MLEEKIVLKNCGKINPSDINSYLKVGGFLAIKKVREMKSEDIINEIKKSGLRGRGGAGFPTGLKWELCRRATSNEQRATSYIICNADEGEPGTFKDRFIIQNDPFSLIEGIIIACRAIDAKKGFIYLREEYHYLYNNLNIAIEQVKNSGFLDDIDIEIIEGAGAYVCGEESALMESIEGKRGDVRFRPPFPPERGLYQLPTIINNVETLMNIPFIILHGAEWFSKFGTEKSKGTKVFSVSGDVKRPGVYELVMGSKLSELLNLAETEDIKFVQVGGASGKIVPRNLIDTVLSFETILGAGAVIVFNERRDVIDIAERTIDFFQDESCGKCTPCREGTKFLHSVMKKFKNKSAKKSDINILEDISNTMMLTSLCGLGQASPNVVIDTIKYFRSEYEEKIL